MDPFSFAPIAAILDAAYLGIVAIADLLEPLVGGASAALAIAAVTLLVRAVLIPVGASQVKAEWARRRVAPKLKLLQEKYTKRPELLQQKMMELYRSENVSPFAGMLPALAQAPIVGIVYAVFIRVNVDGQVNLLLAAHLFGVPLGATLFTGGWPVLLVLALIIGLTAWWGRRTMLRLNPETPAWLSWLSFLSLVALAFVPVAAGLYLAISGIWTQVERALLRRRYWITA